MKSFWVLAPGGGLLLAIAAGGAMMFAVSDMIGNALIAGSVTIILAWLQHRWAKQAAAKVEEVRVAMAKTVATVAKTGEATAIKLNEMAIVGKKTEALCNSAMGTQKHLLAVTARAKAKLTGDAADTADADRAEKEYQEHQTKQVIADTKNGGDPGLTHD